MSKEKFARTGEYNETCNFPTMVGMCILLKNHDGSHYCPMFPETIPTLDDSGIWTHVKDSGNRTEFVTGSVRDIREGKGRFDLIPFRALKRIAVHFENGAKKYGENNWRKGQSMHCYLDSAIRHAYTYLEGARDEDHLAAATWNLICALHTEEALAAGELPKELDDIMKDV